MSVTTSTPDPSSNNTQQGHLKQEALQRCASLNIQHSGIINSGTKKGAALAISESDWYQHLDWALSVLEKVLSAKETWPNAESLLEVLLVLAATSSDALMASSWSALQARSGSAAPPRRKRWKGSWKGKKRIAGFLKRFPSSARVQLYQQVTSVLAHGIGGKRKTGPIGEAEQPYLILFGHFASYPEYQMDLGLSMFMELAITSRSKLPSHRMDSFIGLIDRLAADQIETVVFGNAKQLLLRSPEVCVEGLLFCLSHTKACVNLTSILEPLLTCKSVRPQCIQCVGRIITLSSSHLLERQSALGIQMVDLLAKHATLKANPLDIRLQVLEKETSNEKAAEILIRSVCAQAADTIANVGSSKSKEPQLSVIFENTFTKGLSGPFSKSFVVNFPLLTALLKSAVVPKLVPLVASSLSDVKGSKIFEGLLALRHLVDFGHSELSFHLLLQKPVLNAMMTVEEGTASSSAEHTLFVGLVLDAIASSGLKQSDLVKVSTYVQHILCQSPYTSRRECLDLLQKFMIAHPEKIGDMCLLYKNGITEILAKMALKTTAKESLLTAYPPPIIENSRNLTTRIKKSFISMFPDAIKSNRNPDIEQMLKDSLADILLTTCHPAIDPSGGIWIRAVQASHLSPSFISEYPQLLESYLADLSESALNAIRLLHMILPEIVLGVIIPHLMTCISGLEFTSDQLDIWRCPADKCFHNPLQSASSGTALSEEDKWEQDLRKQIGKLSVKDTQALRTQMTKEAEVRGAVEGSFQRVCSAIQVLTIVGENLVSGLSNSTDWVPWIPRLFDSLLSVHTSVINLTGDKIPDLVKFLTRCFTPAEFPMDVSSMLLQTFEILQPVSISFESKFRELLELGVLEPATFLIFLPIVGRIIRRQGVFRKGAPFTFQLKRLSAEFVLAHIALHGLPSSELVDLAIVLLSEGEGEVLPAAVIADSLIALSLSRVEDEKLNDELLILLLKSLSVPHNRARESCLAALGHLDLIRLAESLASNSTNFPGALQFVASSCDSDPVISALAIKIMEEYGMMLSLTHIDLLMMDCMSPSLCVSANAARSIGFMLLPDGERPTTMPGPPLASINDKEIRDAVFAVFAKSYALFVEMTPIQITLDKYGLSVPNPKLDNERILHRVGIARTLCAALPALAAQPSSSEQALELFHFLIGVGLLDVDYRVIRVLSDAGLLAIELIGKREMKRLLPIFSAFIEGAFTESAIATTDKERERKEIIVIMLGALVKFLDSSNPFIPKVLASLFQLISTPSEPLQLAISQSLVPLVTLVPTLLKTKRAELLNDLFHSPSFAVSRGAAYALAGLAKGSEIGVIPELLEEFAAKSQDTQLSVRQGALFGFEILLVTLGRSLEPWIASHVLPTLLVAFGDSNTSIREASAAVSAAMMKMISGHCIKNILPIVLQALEGSVWRRQVGAIGILGSMSSLSPRLLHKCLPKIIPKLVPCLSDSHSNVVASTKRALDTIGNVIQNPEIQKMTSSLLNALAFPSTHSSQFLKQFIDASFEHYLDPPVLSLVVPILLRGLSQKIAIDDVCRIVSFLPRITAEAHLTPYSRELVPGLIDALSEPVYATRVLAAEALGALSTVGDNSVPILKMLSDNLGTESDMIGASVGLARVIYAKGISETWLPILTQQASGAIQQRGNLLLLNELPGCFGIAYVPYLSSVIQWLYECLLKEGPIQLLAIEGLSILIKNFLRETTMELLPLLEDGLFDASWKRAEASLTLTKKLLFSIANINDQFAEESNLSSVSKVFGVLSDYLGPTRTASVFARIYILRFDPYYGKNALIVWKAFINNTPHMVKELLTILLPLLFRIIGVQLGKGPTEDEDILRMCASAWEEILSKSWESEAFFELLACLLHEASEEHAMLRRGMAHAISIVPFDEQFVPLLQTLLFDSDADTREIAAHAFHSSERYLPILTRFLDELDVDGKSAKVMQCIVDLMKASDEADFIDYLIPPLLEARPFTVPKLKRVQTLLDVCDPNEHLSLFMPLFETLDEMNVTSSPASDEDLAVKEQLLEILSLLISKLDEEGYERMHDILLSLDPLTTVLDIFDIMMSDQGDEEESPLSESFVSHWIVTMIEHIGRRENHTLRPRCIGIMDWLIAQSPVALEHLVIQVDFALQKIPAGMELFDSPKCPLLQIFLAGFINGDALTKEKSAAGLHHLILKCTSSALAPNAIKITGPLIRVLGDAIPQLKYTILGSLESLLEKVPLSCKPFLPQLQRSFVKSLSGGRGDLQDRAVSCLRLLIPLQPRLDPLGLELASACKEAAAMGQTVDGVCKLLRILVTQKIAPATLSVVQQALSEFE